MIGLLLLLALIPFALFRGSQVPEAEAAWWNESWQYRQSIGVTNNTTEQTNVYISVSLDTSNTSKFQADCGDLRFTKQNGQLLPYYIVSGCGTASTSVHVQLDTFPAGAQTFYVYYGNPSADNGFLGADFLTEATNYNVGGTGSEETGPGPVAYWKFDEGNGSTAHDSAGNNNGTINGATWANEDQCVSGKCLEFDGSSNSYADLGDNSITNTTYTIQGWYQLSNDTDRQTILAFNNGSDVGYKYLSIERWMDGPGNYNIFVGDGTDYTLRTINGSETEAVNSWTHFALTRNGNDFTLYVNGLYRGQVSDTKSATLSRVLFGTRLGNRLYGLLDHVKIYDYALTEDQIKTEYNLGAAAVMGTGPGVAPPAGGTLSDSLVAHWAFDEQYGQTAHDKVGNNHGTFGASTSPGSDDPTWKPASECKVNGCASFDGGDDLINVPDNEQLRFLGENFSISFWTKPLEVKSQVFLSKGQGTLRSGYQVYATTGRIRFMYSDTYDSSDQSLAGPTYSANEWLHIVMVVNKDSNLLEGYVNGHSVGTMDITNISEDNNSPHSLLFGRSGVYYLNGLIDEVKIYNTALTADQVKQDMNAGASVAYSVGSEEADELADGAGAPPIAEWKFDEKQGMSNNGRKCQRLRPKCAMLNRRTPVAKRHLTN